MEDHRDFYEWYKTKITENDQDPPQDAWQNIADELDTNEVWDRIAVELDRPSGWLSKATYYALPTLLLLLLSGGAYYYFSKTDHPFPETIEIAINKDEISTPPTSTTETPLHSLSDEQSAGSVETNGITSPVNKNKDGSLDGDEGPSLNTEDSNIEDSEVAATEDKKDAIAKHADNTTVAGNDALAENSENAAIDETADVTIAEVDNASAAQVHTQALNSDHGFSAILRESKGGDTNETIQSSTREDTHETSFEEIANEDAAKSTRSSDRSPERAIFLSKGRASIRLVVMPDSMLSIHPILVELHPDSLGRISTTTDPEEHRYARTFEFGITASAKNTWLLNRTTLAGLEKNTLTTTLPDFGKDLGMVFVYNFSPAFSAQAEGMFISEAGQRYKEYHNGKYVSRDVDLRYYSLNVLLKYNRSKAVYGLPFSGHSLVGGLFAGMLNKATETIGGESIDRSNAYQNMNYGVILGYEYNRYVLPNVVLSSGLRLNYGFPNIDTNLFSRTFTGSLDLNFAVRYRLGL